ncbi:MAG TPA: hypothetical protein VGE02_06880 [Gemmatimonadales bacterium]
MREYVAPDGVRWMVEVRTPGTSNATVVFHHPDDATSRLNRYAWYISRGEQALNVRARLEPDKVLGSMSDADIAMLFRRSMPVHTETTTPTPVSNDGPAWGLAGTGKW